MRLKLVALLTALFAFATVAMPAQTATPATSGKTHRVLFALTSGDKQDWQMTFGNIGNLMKALEPDTVEVEVVAYGPGIDFLKKDNEEAKQIRDLMAKGVHFMACANAMRFHKLTKDDLVEGAEVVPAGIAEVVKKQEAGWTYIKAGR